VTIQKSTEVDDADGALVPHDRAQFIEDHLAVGRNELLQEILCFLKRSSRRSDQCTEQEREKKERRDERQLRQKSQRRGGGQTLVPPK
jgi:hypothetical protein